MYGKYVTYETRVIFWRDENFSEKEESGGGRMGEEEERCPENTILSVL